MGLYPHRMVRGSTAKLPHGPRGTHHCGRPLLPPRKGVGYLLGYPLTVGDILTLASERGQPHRRGATSDYLSWGGRQSSPTAIARYPLGGIPLLLYLDAVARIHWRTAGSALSERVWPVRGIQPLTGTLRVWFTGGSNPLRPPWARPPFFPIYWGPGGPTAIPPRDLQWVPYGPLTTSPPPLVSDASARRRTGVPGSETNYRAPTTASQLDGV